MNINLLTGELQPDMNDVAIEVQKNAMQIGRYKLNAVPDTKQGFTLQPRPPMSLDMPGIYGIYRKGTLLYIGSGYMHTRISRFVKEVQGNSRLDENFPAAKKYRTMWGSNFEGVEIMFCPYFETDDGYPIDVIEAFLIQKLQPLLNTKRGFSKKFRSRRSPPKRKLIP
jgi:hypothetical protein